MEINIFVMQASQNQIENNFISDVAKGHLRTVKSYPVYLSMASNIIHNRMVTIGQLQTVKFALRVN